MKRRGLRAAFAFFLFGGAALGAAACCCSSSEHRDPGSPLQQCLDSCTTGQVNCSYLCRGDAQCSRTCADSYHSCIKVCSVHEQGSVPR